MMLFAIALLLGGGSLRFPLTRLIVEVAAAGMLIWYALRGWRAPVDRWSAAAMILLMLIVLLPLAQIIPLPPSIWTTLPGHDDAANIIEAAGLAPRWMPISLQPDATRLAAAYMIPPITAFIVTLHASPAQRVVYGWVIVAMALVGALLGLLQAGGSESFYIYDTGRFTAVTGLFANKNHHADLLLIAILLTAALTTAGQQLGLRSPSRLAAAGMIVIFALAVPAANSRMGLLLLPVALLPAAVLLLPRAYYHKVTLRSAAIVSAGVAVLVIVGARSGVVTRLLDRFEGDPDARLKFWPDVISAIHHYEPFGSGLGSFIKIFQRHESMGTLHFTYVFHAHNDVMEIALEAGWAGIALILLGLAVWLVGSWRALRPSAWGAFTPVHVASFFGITILAAHSLVDYPLRTLGLACVLAFLAGCLAPAAQPTDRAGG
ncbi:MAG: O-antigen ligase domain-containing protein [Sphingomonas sp.]|nr:MAG: O-antigen ligase domain-containing protein [Sphingomonas sp.]